MPLNKRLIKSSIRIFLGVNTLEQKAVTSLNSSDNERSVHMSPLYKEQMLNNVVDQPKFSKIDKTISTMLIK